MNEKPTKTTFALCLRSGFKVSLDIPVIPEHLSVDRPDDVNAAHEITDKIRVARRGQSLYTFETGRLIVEAICRHAHIALGYDTIEDWAWDCLGMKRRTVFYYKYVGAVYFRLSEMIPEIFMDTFSHNRLIVVGDHILAAKNRDEVETYVADAKVLSIPELQKKYHPKPSDDLFKFTANVVYKSFDPKKRRAVVQFLDMPYGVSPEAFWHTVSNKQFRSINYEIPKGDK